MVSFCISKGDISFFPLKRLKNHLTEKVFGKKIDFELKEVVLNEIFASPPYPEPVKVCRIIIGREQTIFSIAKNSWSLSGDFKKIERGGFFWIHSEPKIPYSKVGAFYIEFHTCLKNTP